MVVIKMKCICICKALCTVLGMKHDWRLRYFVVVCCLLFYSLWPQSLRIELCRKWLCRGVFELIRAFLFFFSQPCLEQPASLSVPRVPVAWSALLASRPCWCGTGSVCPPAGMASIKIATPVQVTTGQTNSWLGHWESHSLLLSHLESLAM